MPCSGLDEEFGSLKHVNSPSEASKLREKVVYSTKFYKGPYISGTKAFSHLP